MLTSSVSLIAKTQGSQLQRQDERWVRGTLTVDLNSISKLLGHAQLSTTSRYLRMARPGYSAGGDALALLAQLPKTPPTPPSPPQPRH